MAEPWDELAAVFQMVFNNPQISIAEKTTAGNIPGWDSFSHMNLMAAIEDHFNIEFSLAETMNFQNVGELMATIRKKQPG